LQAGTPVTFERYQVTFLQLSLLSYEFLTSRDTSVIFDPLFRWPDPWFSSFWRSLLSVLITARCSSSIPPRMHHGPPGSPFFLDFLISMNSPPSGDFLHPLKKEEVFFGNVFPSTFRGVQSVRMRFPSMNAMCPSGVKVVYLRFYVHRFYFKSLRRTPRRSLPSFFSPPPQKSAEVFRFSSWGSPQVLLASKLPRFSEFQTLLRRRRDFNRPPPASSGHFFLLWFLLRCLGLDLPRPSFAMTSPSLAPFVLCLGPCFHAALDAPSAVLWLLSRSFVGFHLRPQGAFWVPSESPPFFF